MEEHRKNIREPLVDGIFYPADAERLRKTIEGLMRTADPTHRFSHGGRGVVSPSASYEYVGATMAAAYRQIDTPEAPIVVVLASGQNVQPSCAALPGAAAYRTPLGLVPLEEGLCSELLESVPCFIEDDFVHLEEHAIETQLPFLQYMLGAFTLLPILVGRADEAVLERMAAALTGLLSKAGRPHMLILGTNLTSYQSRDEARREGSKLLSRITSRNWRALLSADAAWTIGPAGCSAVALFLAALGESAECAVAARSNSSAATSDPSTTVEYASCICRAFDEAI